MAALVLVMALAACGGQEWPKAVRKVAPAPGNVLLASVRTTAAARSARVSFRAAASGIGAEGLAITADGVTDLATGDGQLTLHLTGAFSGLFAGDIDVRTVGDATYVHLPESFGSGLELPGGGKWLKIPTPDLGAVSDTLPGFGQSDPSRFLAYLETVSNGVQAVGTGSIRGVEATHYKAVLDVGKAIDRADVPPSLRDELRQILRASGGSGLSIPSDVWVDGNGLLRRVELQMDSEALLGGAGGSQTGAPIVTVSLDLYDFGVPVHVAAPPADQVTTFGLGLFGSAS